MFNYIKSLYDTVFTANDLPQFVAAGWITQAQADEINGTAI